MTLANMKHFVPGGGEFAILGAVVMVIFMLVFASWPFLSRTLSRVEAQLDVYLNQRLLMKTSPRMWMFILGGVCFLVGVTLWVLLESLLMLFVGIGVASILPGMILTHLDEVRRRKLDEQVIDGITALSSGVRAGLNLVQSMELLVKNGQDPIRQEFQQLLREYELGIDLGKAMQNSSNRIGSSYYRLLFTAIQAHRDRGGDMGESLDRIGEAVREIRRLEGKLMTLTASGRAQARFMAVMPVAILFIMWIINRNDTEKLFTEPTGRLLLLVVFGLILVGFVWIKKIMRVDI